MKFIEKREMERIFLMIKSDDESIRDLAITILEKKEPFRFSFITMVVFHSVLFIANLTFTVYISYKYKIGNYLLPLTIVSLIQLLLSVVYLVSVYDHRSKYNLTMKKLKN